MKKYCITNYYLVALIILFLIFGCKGNKSNRQEVEISIECDQIISQMKAGIGVNFTNLQDSFPVVQLQHQYRSYAGSTWGANPELNDSAAWDKVFNYADWLGIDLARVFVTRNIFEPEKGKYTFDNSEMQYLCKYLDYCQKKNIDVFIQNFFNNVSWLAVPSAGNDPIKILRSAPNDLEAYTDGLIVLLKHLTRDKGYSCIKYICLTNEPFENWSWYIESFDPDKFASPELAYKLMAEKILKNNLPVRLSGPDVSIYLSNKIKPSMPMFDHLNAFDIHSYVTRFDWWADSTMTFEDGSKGEVNKIKDTEIQYESWVQRAKKENKPFIISEMGSFMYGFGEDTNGISTYPALLKDAESVLRYSNIGVDGFMRWSFLNRGNLDGQWQFVNTWDMKRNSILPLNQILPQPIPFYVWGIISRFTPKYANVLKSSVKGGKIGEQDRVFTTAYQSPVNKNMSVYVVNDSDVEMDLSIDLQKYTTNQKFYKYAITKDAIEKEGFELNALDSIKNSSDKIKTKLPPQSIMVFSNYHLRSSEKGIIVD